MKPDITLFGEALPYDEYTAAVRAIVKADLILVCGTSLQVRSSAALLDFMDPHAKLVIINNDPTPYDDVADLVIHDNIGKVLTAALV